MYGRGQVASLIRGWHERQSPDIASVPVTTLDRLIGERFQGKKIFLKIDTEGAEWKVMTGGRGLIARCEHLLVEISLTRNHANGFNAFSIVRLNCCGT